MERLYYEMFVLQGTTVIEDNFYVRVNLIRNEKILSNCRIAESRNVLNHRDLLHVETYFDTLEYQTTCQIKLESHKIRKILLQI